MDRLNSEIKNCVKIKKENYDACILSLDHYRYNMILGGSYINN